jgi:hypothetical protein
VSGIEYLGMVVLPMEAHCDVCGKVMVCGEEALDLRHCISCWRSSLVCIECAGSYTHDELQELI